MTNSRDVEARINQVLDAAERVSATESEMGYEQLQTSIYDLEASAREVFQAQLDDLCQPILAKLEDGVPLTASDKDVLAMLVVGEAKYYLESEDDLENWRREVQRLVAEIRRFQSSDLNQVENLMRLRAYCREAMRVVPDLVYYLREQERVRKFEATSRESLTNETRQVLIDLLRTMLASDKF